jgi:predicted DNA-binding transcriptional regulator YafY
MSDAVPKFERLMNLVAFLLASPEPVPFATIRKTVVGYSDLAREDAVEKRFDRDKKELREIGIPVEYTSSDEQGRDGYFIPLDEYFHHELDLKPEEATLLVVLANAARAGNDAINANLRSALLKMAIDSPLQEEVQEAIAQRHVHAFSRGKRDRAALDNLAPLVAAVAERRGVTFRYRKPNGTAASARQVHPYGVGYREGEWYVVGLDLARDGLRQFKIVRIEGKVKLNRGKGPDFDVPAGFDIEEHVERPPWEYDDGGKEEWARILFHSDVAWMAEESRKPGTKFEMQPDGSGILHLKVRKSPKTHRRMMHYLASFSGQCAILEPQWLRRQAMADLRTILERHG